MSMLKHNWRAGERTRFTIACENGAPMVTVAAKSNGHLSFERSCESGIVHINSSGNNART